ncbi:MAG: hypothetical protein WCP97_05670 [bacterium]
MSRVELPAWVAPVAKKVSEAACRTTRRTTSLFKSEWQRFSAVAGGNALGLYGSHLLSVGEFEKFSDVRLWGAVLLTRLELAFHEDSVFQRQRQLRAGRDIAVALLSTPIAGVRAFEAFSGGRYLEAAGYTVGSIGSAAFTWGVAHFIGNRIDQSETHPQRVETHKATQNTPHSGETAGNIGMYWVNDRSRQCAVGDEGRTLRFDLHVNDELAIHAVDTVGVTNLSAVLSTQGIRHHGSHGGSLVLSKDVKYSCLELRQGGEVEIRKLDEGGYSIVHRKN